MLVVRCASIVIVCALLLLAARVRKPMDVMMVGGRPLTGRGNCCAARLLMGAVCMRMAR